MIPGAPASQMKCSEDIQGPASGLLASAMLLTLPEHCSLWHFVCYPWIWNAERALLLWKTGRNLEVLSNQSNRPHKNYLGKQQWMLLYVLLVRKKKKIWKRPNCWGKTALQILKPGLMTAKCSHKIPLKSFTCAWWCHAPLKPVELIFWESPC